MQELENTTEAQTELGFADVFVLTSEELELFMNAVGKLPTRLGSGIYQGLELVAARGTVKVQVKE